jgi:hypothetical protein
LGWQPRSNFLSQQADKPRIHETVVITDAEHHDALVFQLTLMPRQKLGSVHSLHYEDDICPRDQFIGQRLICIAISSGRKRLNSGNVREDMLSRGASQPVAAANEQEVLITA